MKAAGFLLQPWTCFLAYSAFLYHCFDFCPFFSHLPVCFLSVIFNRMPFLITENWLIHFSNENARQMLLLGTDIRNVIQDILKYAGSCPACNEIMEIRSIALSVWPAQDCFQYVTQFCCEFQKEPLFLDFFGVFLQNACSHYQENYPEAQLLFWLLVLLLLVFGRVGFFWWVLFCSVFLIAHNISCLHPFVPHCIIPLAVVYSLQKTNNFSGRNARGG